MPTGASVATLRPLKGHDSITLGPILLDRAVRVGNEYRPKMDSRRHGKYRGGIRPWGKRKRELGTTGLIPVEVKESMSIVAVLCPAPLGMKK